MEPVGFPAIYGTTNLPCVTTRKSEDLIYTAVEACKPHIATHLCKKYPTYNVTEWFVTE
jgi:hypothetical protein